MNADDFWSYSNDLYRRPGMAPLCLEAQDRLGLDVNFLLFCLYAGRRGHRLIPDSLVWLEQDIAAWREEVIWPLRRARRWLKAEDLGGIPQPEFRDRIMALELEAERLQQAEMEKHLPGQAGAPSPGSAAANIAVYIAARQIKTGPEELRLFAEMLSFAFPEEAAHSHHESLLAALGALG